MKSRTTLILPVVLAAAGIMTVIFGRTAQVGADITSISGNSTLYVLLTASGFLLIAVAAIVALFMIVSSEDHKK